MYPLQTEERKKITDATTCRWDGLLVRPGSPGSRLVRLPGEGGQYAKTTNTQIFSRYPIIDFPTHQNATQIRSY